MIMIDDKNSEIILCSGIKLDKNYENVLSYNEEAMVNLCRNNQIYNAREYTFLGDTNYIDIECPYATSMYANYVAFINPTFGNKWIFAWVTDVKLMNPKTSRIYFDIDVWSTWFSRFNIGKAFIEREHVSDDTIGKHTIPEGLETGEYISQINNNPNYNPVLNDLYYLSDTIIIAGVTDVGFILTIPLNAQQSRYNGVYSGLRYLAFETTQDLELFIRNSEENLSSDNIASLFIAPRSITGLTTSDWITTQVGGDIHYSFKFAYVPTTNFQSDMGVVKYPKPNHLDNNYVPVNKKLLTFPYCFLNITNNSGSTKDYHYELFNDNIWCNFDLKGALGVGCSIKLYPVDYAVLGEGSDLVENKLHSLDAGKLPTCGWLNDAYINWLTSQAVNIPLGIGQDVMQISSGIVTENPSDIIGGFTGIIGQMASIYQHSLQPATAKGGTNQGDLNYAQRNTFNIYPMSIKKEMAIVIDSYFSRFGYKVNEVKTPNINSRQEFNFIKVGGMDELVSGEIPADALEKVNGILRKGVTIFHNYTNIGNYTISNPIV